MIYYIPLIFSILALMFFILKLINLYDDAFIFDLKNYYANWKNYLTPIIITLNIYFISRISIVFFHFFDKK